MKWAGVGVVACISLLAIPGAAAVPSLPPAALTIPGALEALAADGSRVALAVADSGAGCVMRVVDLAKGLKQDVVKASLPCAESKDGADATISGLWLGTRAVAAVTDDSPSPHGDVWNLWVGPPPRGPMHAVAEWGWSEDEPTQYGCTWAVAAGGGVVARTPAPNRLAVDEGWASKPICVGRASTTIALSGANTTQMSLAGQWTLLATDGARLALAGLDSAGVRTGEIAVVGMNGTRLSAPPTDLATVKAALGGWLTASGLVLTTRADIVGPNWTVRPASAATVLRERLFYVRGKELRVRRVRDGADAQLAMLPGGTNGSTVRLAAGTFGLAVATGPTGRGRTQLYRIPWTVVDSTLPAR